MIQNKFINMWPANRLCAFDQKNFPFLNFRTFITRFFHIWIINEKINEEQKVAERWVRHTTSPITRPEGCTLSAYRCSYASIRHRAVARIMNPVRTQMKKKRSGNGSKLRIHENATTAETRDLSISVSDSLYSFPFLLFIFYLPSPIFPLSFQFLFSQLRCTNQRTDELVVNVFWDFSWMLRLLGATVSSL